LYIKLIFFPNLYCYIILYDDGFEFNEIVIDETRSTCLIMFNSILSKFLRKTTSYLLGENDNVEF